jgi:hypothetical protein
VYFTDGYAKSPTDFIESNGYGGYKPKEYTGEFGTNGFHIDAQVANDSDLLVSSIDRNDGDTLFADAAKGHTITKGGDPEHSIAVGNPFTGDGRAIYFDGSDDNLVVTSDSSFNEFGTGDFTIEMWVNPTDQGSGSFAQMFELYDSTSDRMYLRIERQSSQNVYKFVVNGSDSFDVESDSAPDYGSWQHLAVVRNGTSITMYVDGTAQTDSETISSSASYSWPSKNLKIAKGNSSLGSGAEYGGYIFDYRITKGTAQYTSNFTPPTSKLSGDSSSLLLQPTKTDTSIGDSSSNSHTVTTAGSPTRTSSTPYDAAAKSTAMYFDGTGDYLNIGTTSDFRTTTNNFTLDFWFKPDGSSTGTVFSNVNDGNVYDGLTANVSSVSVSVSLRDSSSSNNVVSLAYTNDDTDWHHVEVSRTGSTLYLFVDGNLEDSGSISFTPTSSGLVARAGRVYASSYSGSNNYAGYLFDYRWSNSGGHTASFTAPSAPFELNPVYLGGDQSGNKNHFQPTGISSHDVMLDVPTKNYATLNSIGWIDEGTDPTFAEGNLKITGGSADNKIPSTIAVSSGKWYAEVRVNATANMMMGVAKTSAFTVDGYYLGQSGTDDSWMIYRSNGNEYHNGSNSKFSSGFSTGDILQIALDLDNNKLWWGKNDTWEGTVGTSGETTITAGEYYFAHGYSGGTATWNFGQDNTFGGLFTGTPDNAEFAYEIPTGFKSLNSSNLADPTVTPEEHFNTVLYTGTRDNSNSLGATSNAVTGMGFSAELLWIKDRDNQSTNNGSGYSGHWLFDSVQGSGKAINIDGGYYTGSNDFSSNGTGVSSFTSPTGGFTVGDSEAVNFAYDSDWNGSIDTYERYVAWGWKLGQSGSSSTWASGNTDPTTEKYNASAGVSVIRQEESSGSYPMTGVTVNHSLGEAPEFAFLIDASSNTSDIFAWHKDLDANKYLKLNQTSAQTTGSGYFPSGGSTATTFEIGGDIAGANSMDGYWDIYAYLFSGVEGYSKFGKYTGGSDQFIYTGFAVGFWMVKRIDSTGHWTMFDSARDTHNLVDHQLEPNYNFAESSSSTKGGDFLSNGFKVRSSQNEVDASGGTYVYAAFAESPFKYANAK